MLDSSSILPAAPSTPPIERMNIIFEHYAWCHPSHSDSPPVLSNYELLIIDSESEEPTQPWGFSRSHVIAEQLPLHPNVYIIYY